MLITGNPDKESNTVKNIVYKDFLDKIMVYYSIRLNGAFLALTIKSRLL